MTNPYIGEIKLFAGNFQIRGWAFCQGQLLPISGNEALFSLIGTTYGGNGVNTFALPDLRGRLPMHQGTGPGLSTRVLGEKAGAETVTLTANQIPSHTHTPVATTATGNVKSPGATVIPAKPVDAQSVPSLYVAPGTKAITQIAMAASSIGNVGGSQAHTNLMPTLALNYIIALEGIFPSRN